ncbi:MAG TPA: flagellar basal body P-ring formation chaperone FlgA [Bryobacteraceae bacterium]|nr:flagellar basal body P-ring formation chaperone FlgA [Bryobacteraceae bacterium]
MSAWLLFFTMLNHPATCRAVNGERIFAADLSWAVPAFSVIPRDTIIGYSPVPGSRRILQYPELKRIGARFGIPTPPDAEACFEWRLNPVQAEDVRLAMLESLHTPLVRVELLETSQGLAPAGKLEFPLSGLSASAGIDPATPLMWRGYVLYGDRRKFSLWARVRISATMTRVVAKEALPPMGAVEESQIRLETYDGFPLRNDIARNLEEVVGRVPRRTIRAGFPVFRSDLSEPFDVLRGEMVQVTAVSGAAQLELDAIAEASGRRGDSISFRNPRSGKSFRARVEGKGRAAVVARTSSLLARAQ